MARGLMRALEANHQPLLNDFATASDHVRILLLTSPT
jgi:hypothetical protein